MNVVSVSIAATSAKTESGVPVTIIGRTTLAGFPIGKRTIEVKCSKCEKPLGSLPLFDEKNSWNPPQRVYCAACWDDVREDYEKPHDPELFRRWIAAREAEVAAIPPHVREQQWQDALQKFLTDTPLPRKRKSETS